MELKDGAFPDGLRGRAGRPTHVPKHPSRRSQEEKKTLPIGKEESEPILDCMDHCCCFSMFNFKDLCHYFRPICIIKPIVYRENLKVPLKGY